MIIQSLCAQCWDPHAIVHATDNADQLSKPMRVVLIAMLCSAIETAATRPACFDKAAGTKLAS